MTQRLTTEDLRALIHERDRAFMDALTAPYGRAWCIAPRCSARTEGRHVLTPREVEKRRLEWERDHPVLLID
ncbi:MAG: hypothetical protein QOH04_2592 [Sphingomonadales bacterium]|jgi:hypothetical protein|nr:hypothetical protein [Sphingomonadales bacterium]